MFFFVVCVKFLGSGSINGIVAQNIDRYELSRLSSIYPLSDELVFEPNFETMQESHDSDDSEDSNAENYWTNDYPDSDIDSVADRDLINFVKGLDLHELSSDDEAEEYLYDDVGTSASEQYGESHARCATDAKERQPKENSFYCGDVDCNYYY